MSRNLVSLSLNGRGLANVFAVVLLALFWIVAGQRPALADPGSNFVNRVGSRALAVVGNSALSKAQRNKRFSAILGGNADMRRIGKFALGKYAQKLKGKQRSQYYALVKRFVLNVYFKRLTEFSRGGGGKIKVLGSRTSKKGTIVSTNIAFDNGKTIAVKWRLTKGLKLFDLNVAGVWLVIEQRTNFVSIISRNNGDIGALIAHLRRSSAS